MADHTDCGFGDVTVEQLLMSTIAYNADTGVYYIRTIVSTVDCSDKLDAVICASDTTLLQLLKKVIVIDPCSDKPAFNLANCSC